MAMKPLVEHPLRKNDHYRAMVLVPVFHLRTLMPFYGGEIVSRDTWEMIKESVDRFFEQSTEESIDAANSLRASRLAHDENHTPGFVYFLRGEDYCNIGRTADLDRRVAELKIQLPFKVELFHSIKTNDTVSTERYFHQLFHELRANGEWFKLGEGDYQHVLRYKTMHPLCCYLTNCLPGLAALHKVLYARASGSRIVERDGQLDFDPPIEDETERGCAFEVLAAHRAEILEILRGVRCDVCGSLTGNTFDPAPSQEPC